MLGCAAGSTDTGYWGIYYNWRGSILYRGLLLLWRSIVAGGSSIVAARVWLMLLGDSGAASRDLLLKEGSFVAGCWRVY